MRLRLLAMLAFGTALAGTSAQADWQLNLEPGATAISRSVYDLHMIIFYVCVAIGVLVFGVMLWSVIRHRKSRGARAARFHENTLVEVIWTLIPFVILVAMAVPASRTLIDMYDTSESGVDIKVTGYQWKWEYEYVDEDLSFFSSLSTPEAQIDNRERKSRNYLLEVDNPLVIPTDTKVRFLFTAADVIHSWWVPALAVKKDSIPGYINEAWALVEEPGTYRGQCAELCGQGHGFMPIVVKALPQAEYREWLAETKAAQARDAAQAQAEMTLDELMARGESVYASQCAGCHQPDGSGVPGVFPALAGNQTLLEDLEDHIKAVIQGRPGTAMQAFGNQLNAVDLAAVITYERNAWDNDTGELVQPRAISEYLNP